MNHLTDQKKMRKTMNKEELVKVQRNFFDTTVQVKILTSSNTTYRQVVVKMLVYAENMISAKQVAEDWVIKKLELKDKFEIKTRSLITNYHTVISDEKNE